jgi:hypothetical protein
MTRMQLNRIEAPCHGPARSVLKCLDDVAYFTPGDFGRGLWKMVDLNGRWS